MMYPKLALAVKMPVLILSALCLSLPIPALAQHDCIPYQPSDAGGDFDNDWSDPNDIDEYQFTVPNDPAGGYVTVEFRTAAPVRPWLNLTAEQGDAAISGGGTTDSNPHEISVVFEVAAGETYWLEVYEFVPAPINDHPWAYELSWTFTSRVDCYEPNNGTPASWPDPISTARAIPLEQVIVATSIAGHIDYTIPAGSAHNFDWYEVTLSSPTEISIGTLHVPSDQKIKLTMRDSSNSAVMGTGNPELGGLIQAGPTLLSAGTYYLEVYPFDRGLSDVRPSRGEPIPSHFDQPYHLVVTAQPLDVECGFMPLFCDGFESGDALEWSFFMP
jgi:hypothetical protein